MAKKGSSRHLKRYAAARVLKLPRKRFVWTVKPAAGAHPSEKSLPLRLLVRDYFRLARTAREADKILAERKILIDGKVRRDPKFPLGLMDVVSLPAVGDSYRILLDHRGRLIPHKIEQAEASFKLCKITCKNTVKGKRTQLALHDGKTLLGDFGEYKRKDVVKLSIPDIKVLERIPFEKGTLALIIGGKNVGRIGKISEIKLIESGHPNIVILETLDAQQFQASENYVFVVGKEKPLISLPVVQ